MPLFAAAYAIGDLGCGRRAAADETVMTVPQRRSFMPGRKLLSVRNVAVRLASIAARQPSSVISSSGAGGVGLPPAFATSTSTGPSSRSIRQRMASISHDRVRSAATAIALPPSQRIAATVCSSAAASRPCTASEAPSLANSVAIAAPMPRELPVTSTTFPRSVLTGTLVRFSLTYCIISIYWLSTVNRGLYDDGGRDDVGDPSAIRSAADGAASRSGRGAGRCRHWILERTLVRFAQLSYDDRLAVRAQPLGNRGDRDQRASG